MTTVADFLKTARLEREEQRLRDEQEPMENWPCWIEHLSASSIGTLHRCPELFRRRYILGEIEAPNIHKTWGTANHMAHEHNFRQKIDSHEDVSTAEVMDVFRDALPTAVREAEEQTQKEMDWKSLQEDEVIDRGVQLVAAYHMGVSPRVFPLVVEERFEVQVPFLPVPLIGFADIVTEYQGIDMKTTARKEMKPEWRAQGAIYAAVHKKPWDIHLQVKTKTPQIVVPGEGWAELRIPFTPHTTMKAFEYVRQGYALLQHYWTTYGRDRPWPGAKYIPYSRICGICSWKPSCMWWQDET